MLQIHFVIFCFQFSLFMRLQKSTVLSLNEFIAAEAHSRSAHLFFQNWCETNGFTGMKTYCRQAAEQHWNFQNQMMNYLQECGQVAENPEVHPPHPAIDSYEDLINLLLDRSEQHLQQLNGIAKACWNAQDYDPLNFLKTRMEREVKIRKGLWDWKNQIQYLPAQSEGLLFFDQNIPANMI